MSQPNILEYLRERISKLACFKANYIFTTDIAPELPIKEDPKPTLLLDPFGILIHESYNIFNLTVERKIRPYSEIFLFNISQLYEIVTCSEVDFTELDTFGCIAYKYVLSDKRSLNTLHLSNGRKDIVILANVNHSYNKCFYKNLVLLPEYKGENDDNLLIYLLFLENCALKKAFNPTLETSTSGSLVEPMYNVLLKDYESSTFLIGRNQFKNHLDSMKESRIEAFLKFKVYMNSLKDRQNRLIQTDWYYRVKKFGYGLNKQHLKHDC